MEKQREDVFYEDEIDLYELWLKLKKRWKVIFGTVFLGLIVSFIYILTAPKIYSGTGVIRINYDPIALANYNIEVGKDINQRLLIISPSAIEDLVSYVKLETKYIVSIKSKSLIKDPSVVNITIEAYSPDSVPKAYEELIQKLKQTSTIKEKLHAVKKELLESKSTLIKLLDELNSYKEKLKDKADKGDPTAIAEIVRLNETIATISQQLAEVDIVLSTLKPFEVIVSPDKPTTHSKPKEKLIVAVSLVSSLFLGIFLALFLEWVQEARKRHSEVKT
ncbi:MAG: hypothetical protein GXO18_05585 [Aquificae bacterium]|nr:hypothetical protein [Aquificota bacterium]